MMLPVSNVAGSITMRTVICLSKWNNLFHLMLMRVDGEQSYRLDSRFTCALL